jgi:death-on-curing protein
MEVVLKTHQLMIEVYGGSPGIRDEGLLDSALARPKHLYSYKSPPLHQLAVAYISGIIFNHPFIDGKKRTGFMSGYLFLSLR